MYRTFVFLSFIALVTTLPATVLAQQGYPVEAGSLLDRGETLPSGINDNDFILIKAQENRSYCCKVRSTSFSDEPYFTGVTRLGNPVDYEPRGTSEPLYDTSEEHPAPNKTRLCFIAPDDGAYAFTLDFGGGSSSSAAIRVQCAETTLFGSFNTVVNEFNFLELTNTLRDTEINGYIYALDTVNAQTVINGQAFTVSSDSRTDVSIHDASGSGVFGNLVVIYDGPPGALQARLSQYKVTSSSPLAFELVLQQPLTPRQ